MRDYEQILCNYVLMSVFVLIIKSNNLKGTQLLFWSFILSYKDSKHFHGKKQTYTEWLETLGGGRGWIVLKIGAVPKVVCSILEWFSIRHWKVLDFFTYKWSTPESKSKETLQYSRIWVVLMFWAEQFNSLKWFLLLIIDKKRGSSEGLLPFMACFKAPSIRAVC